MKGKTEASTEGRKLDREKKAKQKAEKQRNWRQKHVRYCASIIIVTLSMAILFGLAYEMVIKMLLGYLFTFWRCTLCSVMFRDGEKEKRHLDN